MPQERVSDLLIDLCRRAKGPLRAATQKLCTPDFRSRRSAYLINISQVKTIWQVDSPVDVSEFYYAQRIQTDSTTERVSSALMLIKNGPVVVEGIAGQGKSVLLRYLAIEAAESRKSIPVFLQLRHIDQTTTLVALVTQTLSAILGPAEPIVLEFLLRSKAIIFMLDGFDEIDTSYRSRTIKEIHDFLDRYHKYPIITTARPNSDIQNSPMFSVAKIRQLTPFERTSLIDHLVEDVDTKNRLLVALSKKENIAGVLTTPLLVTLLIITYKSAGDIPDQLSEFYKALFSTLLKRHDKMKPGFVRERRANLPDFDFERVFETLCFLALNEYKISLDTKELSQFLRLSLTSLNFDHVPEQHYADDLTRVTCLLIQDGDRYFFLHKSIPEYFAAQKVAEEKDEETKAEFYRQLSTSAIPENWYQSIFFLSEIDNLAYVERLLLPKMRELFLENSALELPQRMPWLTKQKVMEIAGKQASLFVKRAGRDRLTARLQTSSENWFASTFLMQPLEAAVQVYVDSLSEDRQEQLHAIASHGLPFDDAFDELSCWQSFLSHLNSDAQIQEAYGRPLAMHREIAKRIRRTRPLFTLNTKRH